MSPSDPDDSEQRRSGAQVHGVRAGIVVVCFVAAVLLLIGPASDRLRSSTTSSSTTTTLAPRPVVKSQTSVQVANGTSVANQATKYSQQLQVQGWNTLPPLDSTTHPPATIVYFKPTFQAAAKLIATELGIQPKSSVRVLPVPPSATGVSGAASVDVVVVIGPDLAHAG